MSVLSGTMPAMDEVGNALGHPFAGKFRRYRRLAIMFEAVLLVILVSTIGMSLTNGIWSWWYLLPIVFVLLLGAVFHVYAVGPFNLDEADQPITGRDADQFALWKLDQHGRRE